jgi:hypothetical protein
LCKLNSPSDIVSQECFDQEVLKVKSIESYATKDGTKNGSATLIDDYTVNLSWLQNTNPEISGDSLPGAINYV